MKSKKIKKEGFMKGVVILMLSQIFIKIMAGILAILMVSATAISLIYSLLG